MEFTANSINIFSITVYYYLMGMGILSNISWSKESALQCVKLLNVCIVKWLLLTLGWLGLVYILEDNEGKVYEEELS